MRLLPFNAIVHAELAHQRRQYTYRRWARILAYIIIAASLLVAAFLALNEVRLAHTFTPPAAEPAPSSQPTQLWNLLNLLPLTVSVVLHFALIFQTISHAGNSIAREKRTNNWEMLLLTGVDTGQIVFGKWWATLKHMGRMALVLAVLRALVIVWLGASITRQLTLYLPAVFPNTSVDKIVAPTLLHFLFAAVVVLFLTLANLGFTAACGIAASVVGRGGLLSFIGAFLVRLLILAGLSGIGAVIVSALRTAGTMPNFENDAHNLLTLLDNGLTLGLRLVSYRYADDLITQEYLLPAALIAVGVYAMFTWLLLRFAQGQLERQNVLPPLGEPTPESV